MNKFEYDRPLVLSIAGFDPTGGAGLLADIKTFEQFKCLGMGVVSATTVQVENDFISVKWKTIDEIKEQCLPILSNYHVSAIKIGIIENSLVLKEILDFVRSINPKIPVVWDPVLSSSSGFDLLKTDSLEELKHSLKHLALLTPNYSEYNKLSEILGDNLKQCCPILLKGGHNPVDEGVDFLYLIKKMVRIEPSNGNHSPKHGSGCILSSAIAAGLSLGLSLEEACREGKNYIENRLKSNTNLLAYHVA